MIGRSGVDAAPALPGGVDDEPTGRPTQHPSRGEKVMADNFCWHSSACGLSTLCPTTEDEQPVRGRERGSRY
eukprot:4590164-Pyramimonas_sp.AAC.1